MSCHAPGDQTPAQAAWYSTASMSTFRRQKAIPYKTVAGKTLTLDELHRTLRTASVNNPGRVSVIIRADKRVVWSYVVAAMNACNKAKIRDYRVTTLEGGA